MQIGIFTVGDVTTDPTTGRTPTENERIKATVAIAKNAEEIGLDVFATGEHHNPPFIASAPTTTLAYIGAQTEKIILSTATTLITTDVAEMRFGAGVGVAGVVLMLTLGTGIGSALFMDGALVPNLELGHIEIRGKDAERRASAGARERRGLSVDAMGADAGRVPQSPERAHLAGPR